MKVYSQNIGRILAKINIKERIFNLPNFSHLVHQYIGRNNKMQRIFKHQFLKKKKCMSDLAQIWELSLAWFPLCNILISNRATSFYLYNHLNGLMVRIDFQIPLTDYVSLM